MIVRLFYMPTTLQEKKKKREGIWISLKDHVALKNKSQMEEENN